MAGNCESLDVARTWIFVIYFIEMVITIVINGDIKESQRDVKVIKKEDKYPVLPFFIRSII